MVVDCNNLWVVNVYLYFYFVVLCVFICLVKECYKYNKLVSICGEMVGDFLFVILLMVMGFNILLMSLSNILCVCKVICYVLMLDVVELLECVLKMSNLFIVKS